MHQPVKPLHPNKLRAFDIAGFGPSTATPEEPPPHDRVPDGVDEEREQVFEPPAVAAAAFHPITPAAWKGTEMPKARWLASGRIPTGDLTILAGNGGSGKTEIAVQLLIYVSAGLADCDRVERICKHRGLDPHAMEDLHLFFPDLDATWLGSADRQSRIIKTPLLVAIEAWIEKRRPHLVVIDSIAAVFDGEAIARRQVRAFLAMLRKIARKNEVAILLLDHPSVRGMADGTGTANSVDWRNSVRSMLHLSDPDKDDQDARTLELKKSNRGRSGEKVALRWTGLTFTTDAQAAASPYRAAYERDVDELFLRLLDKRNAQGRPIRPSTGRGSAPAELAADPEANGTTMEAFRAAMERLLAAGTIKVVTVGPPSRAAKHLERSAL
jgi:RecA-family ATPase